MDHCDRLANRGVHADRWEHGCGCQGAVELRSAAARGRSQLIIDERTTELLAKNELYGDVTLLTSRVSRIARRRMGRSRLLQVSKKANVDYTALYIT